MSLVYPNIVPENNLRLPDALTIKHGPAQLLGRFILEGDKAARRMGLTLRLRHDFEELAYVNKDQVARGNWYPLVNMFNPEQCDLTPENSYWLSGESAEGEIVVTVAWRIFYWPDTNLYQEAGAAFYQREQGPPCEFTDEAAAIAQKMSGVVLFGGAAWVRPDFRGRQLSHLMPRIGRAYGFSRWPVDWGVTIVNPMLVEKGVAAGYGYKHTSYSVTFHGAPTGHPESVIIYLTPSEAYDDLSSFMLDELSLAEVEPFEGASSRRFEHIVTNISSDVVLQGSKSRS